MPASRKILLSAYACEPDKGSEPAVGWKWVQQLARSEQLWVITRRNNQQAIENSVLTHPLPNVTWIYLDLPRWMSFWKRGQRGVHLYYFLWQIMAYVLARRLHAQLGFDLIHHVTFAQYQIPSLMGWIGPPFIFGPVGGGESTPLCFWYDFSVQGQVFELQRSLGRTLGELSPLTWLSTRRSRLALATTDETAQRLRKLGARRVLVQPVFGMTGADLQHFASFPIRETGPFRLISMGRLLHWKGIHLGLRAFAGFHSQYPNSEYWIAGNGAERQRLESLASELGISKQVRFLGNLTLQETHRRMAECDVLLHPALHDSCPVACVEAMSAGRPVICVALGGPAIQVTEETGIKVPASSPRQVVKDLENAMLRLAQDRALRKQMAHAARRRVSEHYNWEKRCESMADVYDEFAIPSLGSAITSCNQETCLPG